MDKARLRGTSSDEAGHDLLRCGDWRDKNARMRLIACTIKNYRSITNTERLPLDSFTALIGPNNEGKSNILRAMAIALNTLITGNFRASSRRRALLWSPSRDSFDRYWWDRDYPKSLQASNSEGRTEIILEFALTSSERLDFRRQVGSNWNTSLRTKLSFGRSDVKFDVIVQGPAKEIIVGKREEVAKFFASHLRFELIPSVRRAAEVMDVVTDMVSHELQPLQLTQEFSDAITVISRLQEPYLRALTERLTETLKLFIPNLKKVSVDIEESLGRAIHQSVQFIVDDGTPTELSAKGDGIQSLAAMAILRKAQQLAGDASYILAIEEPETHLHPEAIHQLRAVLEEISCNHQVIVTSHSPALVDRSKLSRTLLVRNSTAGPAKTIQEIRNLLGVRVSDNLSSATLMLLLEGEEDIRIIRRILGEESKELASAVADGILAFDSLIGCSNLSYKASVYNRMLCAIHAFMDADQSANEAIEKAVRESLMREADIHQATVRGLKESEIEDLLIADVYQASLEEEFGRQLNHPRIKRNSGKWSDRFCESMRLQGLSINKSRLARAKSVVAEAVEKHSGPVLEESRRGPIGALIHALQKRLRALKS